MNMKKWTDYELKNTIKALSSIRFLNSEEDEERLKQAQEELKRREKEV